MNPLLLLLPLPACLGALSVSVFISLSAVINMSSFKIGTKAEAIDTFGIWSCCNIIGIVEEEEEQLYNVSFPPWPAKWNRQVSKEEIRPPTIEQITKRKVPTPQNSQVRSNA